MITKRTHDGTPRDLGDGLYLRYDLNDFYWRVYEVGHSDNRVWCRTIARERTEQGALDTAARKRQEDITCPQQ